MNMFQEGRIDGRKRYLERIFLCDIDIKRESIVIKNYDVIGENGFLNF